MPRRLPVPEFVQLVQWGRFAARRRVGLCACLRTGLPLLALLLIALTAGCSDPQAVSVEPISLKLSCPADMLLIQASAYRSGPFHVPSANAATNTADDEPHSPEADRVLASEIAVPAYCMDRYAAPSASADNPGATSSTYEQAENICRAQGKQLCTPYQWERACRGKEMARFPYGPQYDPACAVPGIEHCQSSYGVYDQLGQAPEWVTTDVGQPLSGDDRPAVMGGLLPGENPATVDCLALRVDQRTAPAAGSTAAPAPAFSALARVRCCSNPASQSKYVLDYDR